MVILSKARKPDNFESHNSLKLSFSNIRGLHSNFVGCESLHESIVPEILTLSNTNLNDSIDSGNFSVRDYLPLIRKDFVTRMRGLASSYYVNSGTSFGIGVISKKLSGFLFMFSTGSTIFIILLLFSSSDHFLLLCVRFLMLFHST